jgi:SAM-dependent methyltransferase
MTEFSSEAIRQSGYLREGFAEHYDGFRPQPPSVLLEVLSRYAGGPPLRRVLDLGSGTGLSTRPWAELADEVIGIEPNPAMRRVADEKPRPHVRYIEGHASDTGLAESSVDLVTCSQSFHWMDREATLTEAGRILRQGGVFAAYDYDPVPTVDAEIEAAFFEHLRLRARYRDELGLFAGWTRRPKHEHLEVIRKSGLFALARELVLHEERETGADELIGFVRSLGLVPELIALGATEDQLGLTRFDETTRRVMGAGRMRTLVGYRVRLGVK